LEEWGRCHFPLTDSDQGDRTPGQKMRYGFIVLWMLFWSMTPAVAQVSIGIGLPGVSIGIHLPLFPELVQVPGYPVYYAPRLSSNYFFYDGLYWVYEEDNWYASSWYDGPWWLVAPEFVPLFVLRIPVRYYRRPPVYFRGWRSDAPPRESPRTPPGKGSWVPGNTSRACPVPCRSRPAPVATSMLEDRAPGRCRGTPPSADHGRCPRQSPDGR